MNAMMSSATTASPAYSQVSVFRSRAIGTDVSEGRQNQTGDESNLLEQSQRETYNLQSLKEGWNGYDALPPSAATIARAMSWLLSSYRECKDARVHWYKPNVTASAEGEVVFEWWASDRSLIVYVEDDAATFQQSQERGGRTEHTHGAADLGESQAALLRWFGE